MHHALRIQEVLSNIFQYCSPQSQIAGPVSVVPELSRVDPSLAALARTCRAFKEPALDVLWKVLFDMSPLAQCLPEASYWASPLGNKYSFSRPLTQTEWNILRNYTRRIRSIKNFSDGLDWDSVATFLSPSITEPLFQNVRALHCHYEEELTPLLYLPLPSLVCLDIVFETQDLFRDFLQTFPNLCPNITTLCVQVDELEDTPRKIEPNYMWYWKNLRCVSCPQVPFDIDTLVQLSQMPVLTRLEFVANVAWPASRPPLTFPNLQELELYSESLHLVAHFLFWIRLPVITDLFCGVDGSPSRQELACFVACVRACNTGHTMQALQLKQLLNDITRADRLRALPIGFRDLQPLAAFRDFRLIDLNLDCNVCLTDGEVLALASAWPKMEAILINPWSGWYTASGVTPGGLLRLLQICPSLDEIALRLDTQGYIHVPPIHVSACLELTPRRNLAINVIDSLIEPESVKAICAFLSIIAGRSGPSFTLDAWMDSPGIPFPSVLRSVHCWHTICVLIDHALGRHYKPSGSGSGSDSGDGGNDDDGD